jgi:hypothetical protein
MLTKITRAADRALKSSKLLRAVTVSFLHSPGVLLCGAIVAGMAKYVLPVPEIIFFIFGATVVVYLAVILLWSNARILVCDVDAGEPDMTGYENVSREAIEKALIHPHNVRRRFLDKIFVGVCMGVLPGFFFFVAIKAVFVLSDGWAFLLGGIPAFFFYIAAWVLACDHTLQGHLKLRWHRTA